MDLRDNTNIIGAVQGLWEGQLDRVEDLNARMAERQFPDQALQPNFEARPVSTKYALFPAIDRRAIPTVPILQAPKYDQYKSFSPATSNGPFATDLANVDTETILQNRHVILQKGADQGVYVPSSRSNLYGFSATGRQESMDDREMLFQRHELATRMPEVARKIGQDRFNNNTRVQLRGLE
jgi:hypothetical protein